MRTTLVSWALLAVLAGCGGGDAEAHSDANTDTETSGSEQPAAIPSAEGWETMSHGDKMAWMSSQVLPHMRALFQEYDADRYADFGCATCHGEGGSEREWAMPSPELPALYPTGSAEQERMVELYRPVLTFMFQRVTPTMQTLIGASDYDEATGEGFSCYACHPHAGDEGTTPISLEPPAEAGAGAPAGADEGGGNGGDSAQTDAE